MAINRVLCGLVILYFGSHVLRNLSALYILLWPVIVAVAIYCCIKNKSFNDRTVHDYLPLIVSVYLLTISMVVSEYFNFDVLDGLSRFFYIIPLLLISFACPTSYGKVYPGMYILLYIIGAFSLIYQLFNGPLPFLAEASERAGVERYSSYIGSLTAYGGGVGIAVYLALINFKLVRYIIIPVLLIGAVISLQKSAVFSLILAFSLYAYQVKLFFNIKTVFALVTLVFAFFVFLDWFPPNLLDSEYLKQIMGALSNTNSYTEDESIIDSLYTRTFTKPEEALSFFEPYLLFGAGVYGAAGGYGYSDLPMAHNQFVELILIYGMFGFIPLLYLLYWFFYSVFNLLKSRLLTANSLVSALYLQWFVSCAFTGGGFVQPYSLITFFMIYYNFNLQRRVYNV